MRFISHLIDNSEARNAIYLASQFKNDSLSLVQQDSLNYYLGWAYYNKRITDTSSMFLDRVSGNSPFYLKSKFYQAFDLAHSKDRNKAYQILNSVDSDSSTSITQLKLLELAGFSLLSKNYPRFDSLSSKFDNSFFSVSDEQRDLKKQAVQMKKYHRKSPVVAGLLSTAVPGLGKFYAGRKGQGLATFFVVGVLGAVTAENYVRGGPKSPQFITFASLFTMFYVGNIWGSAISVKFAKESFYRTKEDEILLTIHIPLRRVFTQ